MPHTHGLLSHGEGGLGVNAPWRLLAHISLESRGLSCYGQWKHLIEHFQGLPSSSNGLPHLYLVLPGLTSKINPPWGQQKKKKK